MAAAVIDLTKVPEMVGIKEAASRTGLTYENIRLLCLNNQITFIRVGKSGGKYLINFESLIRYLNGCGGNENEYDTLHPGIHEAAAALGIMEIGKE